MTCVYGDLKLFQGQPGRSRVCVWSEIGGRDNVSGGAKIYTSCQVGCRINLPFTPDSKNRWGKRLRCWDIGRKGMTVATTALSVHDEHALSPYLHVFVLPI